MSVNSLNGCHKFRKQSITLGHGCGTACGMSYLHSNITNVHGDEVGLV